MRVRQLSAFAAAACALCIVIGTATQKVSGASTLEFGINENMFTVNASPIPIES